MCEFKGGYQMLYCGGSTPTPWDTEREYTEEQFVSRFAQLLPQVTDMSRCIFNVHVPPFGTALDACPKLDKNLQVVYEMGLPAQIHAGCQTLIDIIKEHQPLLGLHGHIHEGRAKINIGKTICINPGSVYPEGILQGAIDHAAAGRSRPGELDAGVSDGALSMKRSQRGRSRMSVTDVGGDKRIFLRKASGLIRTAGLHGHLHLQSRRRQYRSRRRLDAVLRPRLLPQGDLIWGCIIAGVGDGDDFVRLHHLDRSPCRARAAFTSSARASCRRRSRSP